MRTSILICILALCFACTPSKKSTKPSRPTPTRPKPNNPKPKPDVAKMDSIRFSSPSPTTPPPIRTGTNTHTGNTNVSNTTYKVGLLLPFLTNDFKANAYEIPDKSDYALHFYSGAKLAAERLSIEEPNLKMRIDVVDSYVSDTDFRRTLNNPSILNADVFIGPIRGSHITILGNQNNLNHKPIISPFTPSENLLTNYPEYVQINPSLRAHCAVMTQYVLTNYPDAQIVLVAREKEKDRFDFFQNKARMLGKPAFKTIVEADDATKIETNLKPFISSIRPTIFLVPSWSSESFVNAFLRELKTAKGRSNVLVFGMPQWEDFGRIDDDLFQTNQVHLINSSYVNPENPLVQEFTRNFIEKYGQVPNKYAYDGYDALWFTGKRLATSGINFPKNKNSETIQGLRTNIKLETVGANDYQENTSLFILKFQENQFKPLLIHD